jgi:hypothetical protein
MAAGVLMSRGLAYAEENWRLITLPHNLPLERRTVLEQQVREFIWARYSEGRSGRIGVQIVAIEGDSTTKIFTVLRKRAEWVVGVRTHAVEWSRGIDHKRIIGDRTTEAIFDRVQRVTTSDGNSYHLLLTVSGNSQNGEVL